MELIALAIGIVIGILVNPVKEKYPEIKSKIFPQRASFVEPTYYDEKANSLKGIIK